MTNSKSFTLLELLVVIGILAVLTTVLIMVINPNEMMAKAKDTQRVSQLQNLTQVVSRMIAFDALGNLNLGNPNTVYVSLPATNSNCSDLNLPPLPDPWVYHCSTLANLRKTNGTGWLPIDFTQDTTSQIAALPVDPRNTYTPNLTQRDDYFYTYAVTSDLEFEFNAKTESLTYGFKDRDTFPISNPALYDNPVSDGGDNGLLEKGSLLTIIPDSGGLCPTGMVYVPAPARICIDKYEASYSTSGIKPDG